MISAGHLATNIAVEIASYFAASEKLMTLPTLSIGTSWPEPELTTSAVAAHKKNPYIPFGNVVGSNIFNFTIILGISGLIGPASYNVLLNKDIYA